GGAAPVAASFAVVELFTSEGCSSCPPADALLREIDSAAQRDRAPVYALAFHVDYWDALGWADPYASARWSQRQKAYAEARGGESVYTPQMLVNGGASFVGSDRQKAERAIAAALGQRASVSVSVRAERSDDGALRVRVVTNGAPEGAVVNVALVERGLVSGVARGENAGKTLRHDGVV